MKELWYKLHISWRKIGFFGVGKIQILLIMLLSFGVQKKVTKEKPPAAEKLPEFLNNGYKKSNSKLTSFVCQTGIFT